MKPKKINIETEWSELSEKKFIEIAALLFDLQYTVPQLRIKILEILTGYNLVKAKSSIGCSQYIAELTKMFFKIRYDQEVLSVLSSETQNILKYALPEEVDNETVLFELIKVSSLLKPRTEINRNVPKNFIPSIKIGKTIYKGPVFNVNKHGILHTDITAGEWIDAFEYYHILNSQKDLSYLANIAGCFYRIDRKYNTVTAQNNGEIFKTLDIKQLKAICFMFQCWQEYFFNQFNVLFLRTNQKNFNKINLGASQILYSLIEKGYGNQEEVNNTLITDFFSIQLKSISDAVTSLRSKDMDNAKIANALNLDIQIVTMF